MQMVRVLNNHKKKIWVVLLLGGIAAAMMVALLLAEGTTKPAHAGAFPGRNGKIAFGRGRALSRFGDFEIYSMNPNGSNLHNLTPSPGDDYYPSYSANGKKIAFVSNRDGNDEIYKMNSDGTNKIKLTDTRVAINSQPSWQPLH